MDKDNINKIVDALLTKLVEDKRIHFVIECKKLSAVGDSTEYCLFLINLMKSEKFAVFETLNGSEFAILDRNGFFVQKIGYEKYLENKENEDRLKIEHMHLQNQINKWLYRTKLLPYVIAIFSLLISIWSFFNG